MKLKHTSKELKQEYLRILKNEVWDVLNDLRYNFPNEQTESLIADWVRALKSNVTFTDTFYAIVTYLRIYSITRKLTSWNSNNISNLIDYERVYKVDRLVLYCFVQMKTRLEIDGTKLPHF